MTGPSGAHAGQPASGYGTPARGSYDPAAAADLRPGATAHPAPADVGDASVGDLIGNVTRDLSTLMRQELALARAELKTEAVTTGKAAGALGGSGLAAWFAALFLSVALLAALSHVVDPGWAALIVALIWGVIAAVLYASGRAKLRKVHPKPERTVDTLSQVPEALKGQRGAVR